MAVVRYRSQLPAAAEVVVVGAGAVGAASAFFASRAGLQVVVLEARPLPATLTTPASTGAFRLQFDNREELELVRESVEVMLAFSEVTGQHRYDLRIRRQGYLWATTSGERAAAQRELVARQHSWGQTDIELLSGEEARRRFPHLAPTVLQARFRAGDGFLDPKALTLGFLAGSQAEVVTGCRVTGMEPLGKGLRVTTSLGVVEAERVVVAAGPFSGRVAALAGVELPIETVTRHKVVMPEVPEVPPQAPMTIDDDTGTHWRPALAGAYLLFTDPATPPSEPAEELPPDAGFALRILDPASPVSAARISPFWREVWERGDAHWLLQSGQYTVTPDHRPLIGPTPIEGLWVNTGYSGHGIMGSPAGGRILADLLCGRLDLASNPFRVDRPFRSRPRDVL